MKRTWKLALALGLFGSGCNDAAVAPPVPGEVWVVLSTAHSDDGAIVFTLAGPGIGDLEPASTDHVLYLRRVSADEVRVLVVGNLTNGVVLRAGVADVNDLTAYAARLAEVATRDDQVRESIGDYALQIATATK